MMSILLSLLAQDVTWVETRFHRVHLRNGNFIDGRLVRESPRFVTLEVRPAGEFGVRRDMIQRVEFIKMRSIKEEPPIVAERASKAEPTPPAVKPGVGASARPARAASTPARFAAALRKSVEETLAAYAASNKDNRRALAPRLRELGQEAVAYACWLALNGETIVSRPELVAALGDCETPDVVPALMEIGLGSPDSFTRLAAVQALGRLDAKPADRMILKALQDHSSQVWRAAVEEAVVLYKKGRVSVAEIVSEMDALEKKEVHALLLAQLGGEAALDAVRELLRDGTTGDKIAALRSLAPHADAEDARMAMDLLVEGEDELRRQAAQFLGRAKVKAAVRALLNLLKDDVSAVADSAHWSLRQITGLTYTRDPELWDEWWRKAGRAEFPSPVED